MNGSRRHREMKIAEVLARYELGQLADSFGLDRLVSAERSVLHRRPLLSRPESLRMALEELGPTFIKVGQALSTRGDLLPQDFQAELAKLQDSTTPISPEIIEQTIRDELGASTAEVFATFDHRPLATASIGQVHAATLHDGTELVVKVRRPGVAEQVEEDLDILLSLAARAKKRSKQAEYYDFAGLARDFSEALRAELDYTKEARNAQQFAVNFAGDGTVHIPTVHLELSTARVLTLERIDGVKITDLARLESLNLDRTFVAEQLANAVAKMVLEDGYYHGDPHPGNFFVETNGRIGIVDFGRVGRLEEDQRSGLSRLLLALLRKDADRLTNALLTLSGSTVPVDHGPLRRDLTVLLSRYAGRTIQEIPIRTAITEVMEIARRHQLVVPSDLALLFAVLVMDEGITERLDPGFRFEQALRPYMDRRLRATFSPASMAHRAERLGLELAEVATELPGRLYRLLEVVGEGQFEVRLRPDELQPIVRRMERLGNRVAMSILAAAVIDGLTELAAHDHRATIDRKRTLAGALAATSTLAVYSAWRRSPIASLVRDRNRSK